MSGDEGEYTNAIYEVKFKHKALVIVELVAKFYEGKDYCFEAARIFNRSKLYWLKRDGGYIIDTNTRARSSSLPPTLASKPTLTLVSASGKLYCLAISWSYPRSYKPILETPSRGSILIRTSESKCILFHFIMTITPLWR